MANTDNNNNIKIFSLTRLKFTQLYEDALTYIKAAYNAAGQTFTPASPFGQLLTVLMHLGRMIFYYIEDSISGLNIRTAYRPDQVKGLAMLAGHDASRPISARGAVRLYYYDTGDMRLNGNICYIPNKLKVVSRLNGYNYVLLFGAESGKITMTAGNYLEATIVQGVIKMQYMTGTGMPLQSYNFAERNFQEVDQYYVNVYVNGEVWEIVSSITDLGFNQKGCVVRTGINGGIDVFFGNGTMGAIPPLSAYIICEYIVSDGENGNLSKDYVNADNYWQIETNGVMSDGSDVKLQGNFKITMMTDIIFGTFGEDTALTQLIAPHVSRSFVLANETNYKYFFKRMNMFSSIEVIRGTYNVNGTAIMQLAYDQANKDYNNALLHYNDMLSLSGSDSEQTVEAYKEAQNKLAIRNYAATKLTDNTMQDNTIYILLVPDIKKRISSGQNYFTCDESLFTLSKEEQENIINLINASGQRIITIENRIIQPKTVRFAVNVRAKIWDNYDKQEVYTSGLNKLSEYFLNYERKDIIPISDIIAIFEKDVEGIDSVQAWFSADVNNQDIYGIGDYGIDQFGDIKLSRRITDNTGSYMDVHDMIPLIRGGFVTFDGEEYSSTQTIDGTSAFNLYIADKTVNKKYNLNNYTVLT